ncbi:unnamed protein product [Orchesella dallaii]|uniref:CBM21 domain-containing protein n=1 Tax=Orchesella dallaii TaxID=48710 RepID=A0ABP1PKL4_9HEXA
MEVLKDTEHSANNNTLVAIPTDQELASRVRNLELNLLSPSSPPSELSTHTVGVVNNTALFAQRLQMKLKSHLEASDCSSSSSEEYFTNSTASHEEDTTSSNSEIFYDFDDVVYDEELTSDYGTGGSNTTVVASRSSSSGSSSSGSSVVVEDNQIKIDSKMTNQDTEDTRTGVTYRRSSSLKSGKTPPGTPMKKIVRFADAMGLDLTDIKVFLDEIPKVPKEAYRDLHIPDYSGPPSSSTSNNDSSSLNVFNTLVCKSNMNFVPLFHQPVTMPDFFDKIRDQKVLLENAYLTQETISNTHTRSSQIRQVIKGSVRVMNLDFHKSVYVRYTYNDWKDFQEFQATYMAGSCDGFSDKFEFRVEIDESRLPAPYLPGHDDAKVQFACRFHCQGKQFWDNNQSRNYVFQNVPTVKKSGYYDEFDFVSPTYSTPPNPNNNTNELKQSNYSGGGGGGSHATSLYSPSAMSISFYDHAYGSNQFGSACFY